MSSGNKIRVKFEYSMLHDRERIFTQPLFYLAMNIKNKLLQAQSKPYNTNMISPDLNVVMSDNLKLEMAASCLSEADFNLNYISDRYASDYAFTYKEAAFQLQTDKTDVKNYSLKIGHDEHTVTSVYTLTYSASDFALFEEFLKASVQYFKKYFAAGKEDKKKLTLFISSDDGAYFDNIGTRAKRSLESVFLPPVQKQDLLNLITKFISPPTIELYKDFGINHKLTILFEGIPGTGKSSFITALASHFNLNIALISFTPKMTDVNFMRAMRMWERNIKRDKDSDKDSDNEENRGTLLVIEDMDCIFKERKSNDENRNMVTFSGILNALDGITTCENQIVILTTNHIENLDPALIRPGRVDHIMRFDYATKAQIKEIFQMYTKRQTTAKAVEGGLPPHPLLLLGGVGASPQAFYEAVQQLNIQITTSLLQQFLLKYADKMELIMENISDLKTMYDACHKQSEAKMYT